MVIFTEALTHGTLPWAADHQRRVALFRYNSANMAYAGGRHPYDNEHRAGDAWPAAWYEGLSDAQRAGAPQQHRTAITALNACWCGDY